MEKIKILVADDHSVLRAGLRLLLNAQPDMEVVGEAADGEDAVGKTLELKPDVVLLDISMPLVNGFEALARIRGGWPAARILVLSMHEDEGYLTKVLKAGAAGYVPKKAADTELLSAIRAVHRGEIFIYPSLTRALVKGLVETPDQKDALKGETDNLTEREQEVLKLIAMGYTNQQISEMLTVSVKTVETHKSRIMAKLNMYRRSELVRYAVSRGLVSF
ncbi:MAG: response regulator transcription factor [Firmicutes bacterium]|nr:response regulator transcription factor [Bacillota bacterium]